MNSRPASVEPEDESYSREYSGDTYQPEDESVRSVSFLRRASRSRDGDQGEQESEESSEGETQDLEELRRRQEREAQRRMDLHCPDQQPGGLLAHGRGLTTS